jgi:DNA-binding transcriptional ArsR family regulator
MYPLAVAILENLADGESRSPKELAERFGKPLPNVAYHVGTLPPRR